MRRRHDLACSRRQDSGADVSGVDIAANLTEKPETSVKNAEGLVTAGFRKAMSNLHELADKSSDWS